MAAVNSRIPHGRPSRIPSGGSSNSSRLLNASNRKTANSSLSKPSAIRGTTGKLTPSSKTNSCATEKYRLTAKSATEAVTNHKDTKRNYHNSNNDKSSLKDFSVNPLRNSKNLVENHLSSSAKASQNCISSSSIKSSDCSNTVNKTATSNQKESVVGVSSKRQKYLSNNFKESSLSRTGLTQSSTKASQPIVSRSATFILKARTPLLKSEGKNQIALPPSHSQLSAANAMEYVKKITTQDSLSSSGLNHKEASPNQEAPTKSSQIFPDEQWRAKTNLNTTFQSQSLSTGVEISVSSRSETRFQHGLSKSKFLADKSSNVADAVHDHNDVNQDESRTSIQLRKLERIKDDVINFLRSWIQVDKNDISKRRPLEVDQHILERSKPSGVDSRKPGSIKTPRIVRPVARPPRRRDQTNENEECTNPVIKDLPEFDELINGIAEEQELSLNDQELNGYISVFSRKSSAPPKLAPSSPQVNPRTETTSSSQSQVNLGQSNEDITKNLSIPNLDKLEKKSQDLGSSENNRYNHILTSPTIVSFGQYRLEQEGNYAPEEKYGFTERRSIRSSFDSDNITSPTRESKFAPTDSVDLDDVREHKIDHESYLPGTSKTDAADNDEKGVSTQTTSNTLSNVDNEMMTGDCSNNQQNSLNTDLNPIKLKSDSKSSIQSSPLRTRAASDDICKFCDTASTASSTGYLKNTLDDLVNEYKTVRVALENLYHHLSDEENDKARLETVVEKLQERNCNLTDEVNRLTRIMEFQLSPANKRRNPSTSFNKNTADAEVQTEGEKLPRKSNSRATKNRLTTAIDRLNKAKKQRQLFDDYFTKVEEELSNCINEIEE